MSEQEPEATYSEQDLDTVVVDAAISADLDAPADDAVTDDSANDAAVAEEATVAEQGEDAHVDATEDDGTRRG